MSNGNNKPAPTPEPEKHDDTAEIIGSILLGAIHIVGDALQEAFKPDPNYRPPPPPPPPPPCRLNENPPVQRMAAHWAFTTSGSVDDDIHDALLTCGKLWRNCKGECATGLLEALFGGRQCLPVVIQQRWGTTAKYLIGRKARLHYICDCKCLDVEAGSVLFGFMDGPYWQRTKDYPIITDPDGNTKSLKDR
jgi:hypothetical protein